MYSNICRNIKHNSISHVAGSNLPLALSLLVYMLPDVRTTPNSDKVIFFTEVHTIWTFILHIVSYNMTSLLHSLLLLQDSDIHQTVQKREMPHPYILVENANTIEAQCHLVTDCQIICQGKVSQIPALLLAAFYVFNICYPPGCKNFYSFMEVIILGNPIKKAAPSVKHVYASLFNWCCVLSSIPYCCTTLILFQLSCHQ